MHKRMLRSALAAAFSAVVTLDAVSGFVGAQGDARAGDSTWRVSTTTAAADPGDSTWVSPVSVVADPGDSTWIRSPSTAAGPGDSTWAVPVSTGGDDDSPWSVDDGTWVART